MKKILSLFIVIAVIICFTACGGKVSNVEIIDWTPSQIYTDKDIQSAIDTVKDYFKSEFAGCTLTQISYPGDTSKEQFVEWAEQYDADEAIMLYSSFDVDSSGGDGSLNPNSTYTDWKWILVRNDGESWQHKTHGYG